MALKENIFNLPNLITSFRLLLIPTMCLYIFYPKILFSFILLAFILDMMDGFLARKLKLETRFGFAFDSFVDKAFMFFIFVILILYYHFNILWAILIFSKDIIIVIYRIYSVKVKGFKKQAEIKITLIGKFMWPVYLLLFASILFDIYPIIFIILTILFNFVVLYNYWRQIK